MAQELRSHGHIGRVSCSGISECSMAKLTLKLGQMYKDGRREGWECGMLYRPLAGKKKELLI